MNASLAVKNVVDVKRELTSAELTLTAFSVLIVKVEKVLSVAAPPPIMLSGIPSAA
jgi:hypothetical protein